jgi:hypothetical protein
MTRVVVDAEFGGKLNNPQGPVELCDPSGRTLGYLYPVVSSTSTGHPLKSPITEEELQRRCEQRGGRSLQEILNDLEKR